MWKEVPGKGPWDEGRVPLEGAAGRHWPSRLFVNLPNTVPRPEGAWQPVRNDRAFISRSENVFKVRKGEIIKLAIATRYCIKSFTFITVFPAHDNSIK